jgi:hypothetical protein
MANADLCPECKAQLACLIQGKVYICPSGHAYWGKPWGNFVLRRMDRLDGVAELLARELVKARTRERRAVGEQTIDEISTLVEFNMSHNGQEGWDAFRAAREEVIQSLNRYDRLE